MVAVLSDERPLPGLDLGEVMGIADVPGGVVNLLSGRRAELARRSPATTRLNAIVDATRRRRTSAPRSTSWPPNRSRACVTRRRDDSYAPATADPLSRLEALTELKTAWHPVGA